MIGDLIPVVMLFVLETNSMQFEGLNDITVSYTRFKKLSFFHSVVSFVTCIVLFRAFTQNVQS